MPILTDDGSYLTYSQGNFRYKGMMFDQDGSQHNVDGYLHSQRKSTNSLITDMYSKVGSKSSFCVGSSMTFYNEKSTFFTWQRVMNAKTIAAWIYTQAS